MRYEVSGLRFQVSGKTIVGTKLILQPVPCTLHPAQLSAVSPELIQLLTLYPVPCNLYPVPLHPATCTLYPVPCTLYPVPCTLQLATCTLLPVHFPTLPAQYFPFRIQDVHLPTINTLTLKNLAWQKKLKWLIRLLNWMEMK